VLITSDDWDRMKQMEANGGDESGELTVEPVDED
jgi:hypothetical protein